MNTTFASPADAAAEPGNFAPAAAGQVLVWDAVVRVGHWLMVASFAGAWLTAESDAELLFSLPLKPRRMHGRTHLL